MKVFKINVLAYLIAVVIAYFVGVALIAHSNTHSVIEMGYAVSLSLRLATMGHDFAGMALAYLPLLAIAFLIAFLFTHWVIGRWKRPNLALYVLAGFTAVITIHLSMGWLLGLVPFAPTRTPLGLMSQGLAGAVGGWMFYRTKRLLVHW